MTLTRISTVTIGPAVAVELSFCVVNTEQRELLVRCLDAIAAERATLPFATEVLVLDNASGDGSAAAARRHALAPEVIALDQRARARARTTRRCSSAPAGATRCCSTRTPSCGPGRWRPCATRWRDAEDAAAAGARLLRPDGTGQPSAWRFPTPATALIGALFLHRRFTVQSRGERTRTVDWAQSAALLVRIDAAREVGGSIRRSSSTPTRSTSAGACATPAGARCTCRRRAAVHHEQLSTGNGPRAADRRALAQPRPLHAQAPLRAAAAAAVRVLTAWAYARARRSRRSCCPATIRGATGATSPRRCAPSRGEGLREAAIEHNRGPRSSAARSGLP